MELVPLSPFLKITHSPFPNYTRHVLLPWSLCYPTVTPTTPPSWFSWQAVAKYHFLNLFQQASPSYNALSPWYIINSRAATQRGNAPFQCFGCTRPPTHKLDPLHLGVLLATLLPYTSSRKHEIPYAK